MSVSPCQSRPNVRSDGKLSRSILRVGSARTVEGKDIHTLLDEVIKCVSLNPPFFSSSVRRLQQDMAESSSSKESK